jgi:hypothetical protein
LRPQSGHDARFNPEDRGTEMSVYGYELRSCATCAYWGGPRKAVNMRVDRDIDKYVTGPCNHLNRRGVPCNENAVCQDYLKWSAILDHSLEIITG